MLEALTTKQYLGHFKLTTPEKADPQWTPAPASQIVKAAKDMLRTCNAMTGLLQHDLALQGLPYKGWDSPGSGFYISAL